MSRKLALKRLTGSDLTTFEYLYRNQDGNSRQKAINLNSEVFIKELYPLLPKYLGEDGKHLDVPAEIYGPGEMTTVHIPDIRTITPKTPQQKNWRLAGNLIANPSNEPLRYNSLKPEDLVMFEFIGEDFPIKVRMLFVSNTSKSTFSDLNQLLNKENKTMVTFSEEEVLAVSNSDTVLEFLSIKPVHYFKPKAHILKLLGEELIKSPVMAIYELVKNSYDADSTEARVQFQNLEDPENTTIIITDKGTGITEEVLLNVWLEPGTDFRKPVDEQGNRKINRTPIYKRVPMGEKGVGRFAVHKLGEQIRLITRPAKVKLNDSGQFEALETLDYELEIHIDWNKFSQSKYLDDVPVQWVRKNNLEDFHFKHFSGTRIEISKIKESWTRGMSRQLKRSTLAMLSPRAIESSFKIELDFGNDWLAGYPSTTEVLEQAPYKMTAIIDRNYDLDFEYSFNPKNNKEIGYRTIRNSKAYNKNVRGLIKPFFRSYLEEKEYDKHTLNGLLDKYDQDFLPFGEIMVEIYSYDLDSKSLRDTSQTSDLIKKVLKDHAGIKVFKDDLRVFDYGEPGNDWLGLDIKRVNRKEWFSNNQNIGYVYLDSEYAGLLVEKTNREGFIHDENFDLFKLIIEWVLTQFKEERLKDREKWLLYNKGDQGDGLENKLNRFKKLIEDTDLSDSEKKVKLLKEAEKVEKAFQKRQETLLIPAGVGMTASVALHEIDKLVPRMEETVKSIPLNKDIIKEQVDELKAYVGGILSVLKKGGDEEIDISSSIYQALNNYSVKLKLRGISSEVLIEEGLSTVNCDKRYFVTMIMNLIDNSIYWLETIYSESKDILINSFSTGKSIHVIVADNGPGFMDAVEDIVKPFHSRKDGGIGLGLYIVDTIMIKYGKLRIYNSEPEFLKEKISNKYTGAIVELIFNKTN